MALPQGHYLWVCLDSFKEVTRRLYGRPFRSYQELDYFVSRDHWWFENYWVFPPEEKVSVALRQATFDFWNLPKQQERELRKLLAAFKSIDLVSIILRFVQPKYYGIISPLVERVLDVRRGNDAVETYENYVQNLREIQTEYRFMRAADVDMVLHQRCYGSLLDTEIKAAYESDLFMLRLRAKNLTAHLLTGERYARFAEALEHVNPGLAAVVASYTFEIQVRALADALGEPPRMKLAELIDSLPPGGPVTQLRKARWKAFKGYRDGLFHQGKSLTAKQIRDLVAEVAQLEGDVGQLRAQRATLGA